MTQWSQIPIDQITATRTGTNDPRKTPDRPFWYVDIASVDNQEKRITGAKQILGRDAPSRARKLIRSGDVLVSTTRPNLNAVALVSDELDGQICSTGFAVLRPKRDILPEYLYLVVQQKQFVDRLSRAVSGAMYPAVTETQVKQTPVPVPSLSEQRRIVDILNRAHGIRQLRREAQEKARQVIPALFVTSFGEPISNTHGWTIYPLGELVRRFVGGKNLEAGSGKSPYRILRVSAVTSGTLRPEESKPAPDLHEPSQEHFVSDGDLLFSRANTQDLVGATAIAESCPPNVLLPDKIWRIQWEPDAPILPEYALGFFQNNSVRQTLGVMASGTSASMKNISQKKLKSLGVPIPPLKLQEDFASRARSMVALSRTYAHQSETTDRLADTLGHHVFC